MFSIEKNDGIATSISNGNGIVTVDVECAVVVVVTSIVLRL